MPALVERFQAAGADVTLTVDGDTGRLPATVGLAVYRILQEALTNVIRHAPGAPASARLVVSDGMPRLTVDSLGQARDRDRARRARHAGTSRVDRRELLGRAERGRLAGARVVPARRPAGEAS